MQKIAAIHFGAGNIGRGLIAKLYKENNIFPIFIDPNKNMVNYFQENNQYKIFYDDETFDVINEFAIFESIKDIKTIINDYEIKFISTSIGTKNFEFIKDDLKILLNQFKNNEINIIAFENDFRASTKLKKILNLNDSHFNFIDALVDRIVPVNKDMNNFDIFTEKYFEIILDNNFKKDDLIFKSINWANKFEPFLFRKFWIIN